MSHSPKPEAGRQAGSEAGATSINADACDLSLVTPSPLSVAESTTRSSITPLCFPASGSNFLPCVNTSVCLLFFIELEALVEICDPSPPSLALSRILSWLPWIFLCCNSLAKLNLSIDRVVWCGRETEVHARHSVDVCTRRGGGGRRAVL